MKIMIDTKKLAFGMVAAAAALLLLPRATTHAAGQIACDADNGGITLPSGFCALVVANNLGEARHATVAPNGDLYVALMNGGVVGLHDSKGDGHFDVVEKFGQGSATGIEYRGGYLWVAHLNSVDRYKMTAGQLKPSGAPEIVASGLEGVQEHGDKGIAFDGKGSFYVNVGAPSNACQARNRQKGSPGQDPCPILEQHGGIWKFSDSKLGQTQADGVKYATGMRQMPAIAWHNGALFIVMNSRDQLDYLYPEKFTAEENATRPAEPMYRVDKQGDNFGWPYCFYDYSVNKLLLNPEYGGDGKMVGRCSEMKLPITSFPAHWAPVDAMFYTGTQFPEHYRNGMFIAFHGSWNRAPLDQAPSNVTFQAFKGNDPDGKFEIFAGGFAGKEKVTNNNDALARADGVAQAPDGSLYITESQKGKVWRVFYRGAK
jgi:glucose/arabinose dehydrogenase